MHRNEHMGRSDQRKAALRRKADAWALLRGQIWANDKKAIDILHIHTRGAVYLGGYAIECKLKAVAMEAYDCWNLDDLIQKCRVDERDVYTHGIEAFFSQHLPALYRRFKSSDCWKVFASKVNRWRPSWRYNPKNLPREEAVSFMEAVDSIYNWLESNKA